MEKVKQKKGSKAGTIVANTLTIVVCLFVLFIVVNWFISRQKGYTSYFGTVYLVAVSDSMEGDKPDSFNKGDIIKIKELSDSDKLNLKEGDIITFWDNINAKEQLNSHRFVGFEPSTSGNSVVCVTESDKYGRDSTRRPLDKVVGIYQSKASGVGETLVWMQTPTGFLVCAVIPAVLILIYCVIMVIQSVGSFKKVKNTMTKEQLREQLIDELRREGVITQSKGQNSDSNQDAGSEKKEE